MIKSFIYYIIFLFFIITFDYLEDFFIILFVVSLHELSHIIVASIFKLKIQKVCFTPIGQFVSIKDIDLLKISKKLLIYFAGSSANIILYFIVKYSKFETFRNYNLIIALFNLLPCIPLDGGKILHSILAYKDGVFNANKIILKISNFTTKLLFFVGIIQFILYPFNISLLCICVYINKTILNEIMNISTNFFKFIVDKNKLLNKNVSNVDFIVVNQYQKIKYILFKLCWHKYYIIHIINKDKILCTLTEFEFVDYILIHGVQGNVDKLLKNF